MAVQPPPAPVPAPNPAPAARPFAQETYDFGQKILDDIQKMTRMFIVNMLLSQQVVQGFRQVQEDCTAQMAALVPHLAQPGITPAVIQIRDKLYQAEAAYFLHTKKVIRRILGIALPVLLGLVALFWWLVSSVSIPTEWTVYIVLGIMGVVINLVVAAMTMAEEDDDVDMKWKLSWTTILHLVLTLLVLVALRTLYLAQLKSDMTVPCTAQTLPCAPNNSQELGLEVLAFACGYSAKLVLKILKKVVDKGSSIIDAL